MRDVIQVERQDGTPQSDSLAQLGRVVDELLPPLIARLGVSDLAEIEVRQGAARVRIRRAVMSQDATTAAHPAPGAPAAAGHATHAVSAQGGASQPVSHAPPADASGGQPIARSTAVGYFGLRPGLAVGHRVTRGDALGWVDVLGVRMEVVAPSDGVIERFVTEPGDPVEYGQELVAILAATGSGGSAGTAAGAAGTAAPATEPAQA